MDRREFVKGLLAAVAAVQQVLGKGLAETATATPALPVITKSPDDGHRKGFDPYAVRLSIDNKIVGDLVSVTIAADPPCRLDTPPKFVTDALSEITFQVELIDGMETHNDLNTTFMRQRLVEFSILHYGGDKHAGDAIITDLQVSIVLPDEPTACWITILPQGQMTYTPSQ